MSTSNRKGHSMLRDGETLSEQKENREYVEGNARTAQTFTDRNSLDALQHLYAPRTRKRLSPIDMLRMSRRLMLLYPGPLLQMIHTGRQEHRLVPFARNSLETCAANYWDRLELQPFAKCVNDEERAFLFRAAYVPLWCVMQLDTISKEYGRKRLWFYQLFQYMIAWERMHLEMVLTETKKPENDCCNDLWMRPYNPSEIMRLPLPSVEWFLRHRGESEYWTARFDAWHNSVRKSFLFYLREENASIKFPSREIQNAAIFGAIDKLEPMPESLKARLVYMFEKKQEVEKFVQARKCIKSPDVGTNPKLDHWLIELEPLFQQQRWRPALICLIAQKGAGGLGCNTRLIKSRLTKLDLKTHPNAPRGGPVPKLVVRNSERLWQLYASWLKTMVPKNRDWTEGQRELVSKVKQLILRFI